MKKIIVLLLVLVFANCSQDFEDCGCVKETWETETVIVFGSNGLPRHQTWQKIISKEKVECQDEVPSASISNNIFTRIKCD